MMSMVFRILIKIHFNGYLNNKNNRQERTHYMNIRSIIFADDTSDSFSFTEAVITEAFASLTGGSENQTSVYSTVQYGMKDIAAALKTSNIIAIFAQDEFYHEAKRIICKAFKFDMIHCEEVLAKLSTLNNAERYMMHALMPKNATPFPLADGLFPGFAVRSKNQCIFFLPFSQDRTFITMKKFVFPYISRLYGANLPSFNEYEIAYSAGILENKLIEANTQIAIANTPICKYIAHAGKKISVWSEMISYAPYEKQQKAQSADSLTAVKAAEYYECQFGAAVTEGEKDEFGCYTATISISNRKTATIRTISSIPDENHDDFMNTVVTEFFLMLSQELEKTPVMTTEEIKHISPKPAIHGSHILLYIILFATAFFLTYVAASFSDLPIFS